MPPPGKFQRSPFDPVGAAMTPKLGPFLAGAGDALAKVLGFFPSHYEALSGWYEDGSPVPQTLRLLTVLGAGSPAGVAANAFKVPAGALGTFAGTRALTAPMERFGRAAVATTRGDAPADIWRETGWWKGPDRKWRWEIPDDPAQLTGLIRPLESSSLANTLEHPELYRAYPSLRSVKVEGFKGENAFGESTGQKGNFSPRERRIWIATNLTPKEQSSTLLHEIQHAIQSKEGFSQGASPFVMLGAAERHNKAMVERIDRQMDAILARRNNYAAARVGKIPKKGGDYEDAYTIVDARQKYWTKHPEIHKRWNELFDQRAVFRTGVKRNEKAIDLYRRKLGEVEARAVQERLNVFPPGSQRPLPSYHYDVPLKDLLIRNPRGSGRGSPF